MPQATRSARKFLLAGRPERDKLMGISATRVDIMGARPIPVLGPRCSFQPSDHTMATVDETKFRMLQGVVRDNIGVRQEVSQDNIGVLQEVRIQRIAWRKQSVRPWLLASLLLAAFAYLTRPSSVISTGRVSGANAETATAAPLNIDQTPE